MRKIFIVIIFILGSIVISCHEDSFVDTSNTDKLIKESQEKMSFTYLDKTYSSTYHKINDSIIVLDDPIVNSLYQEINKLPNLLIHFDEEGNIIYYDDFESYLKRINKNTQNTRESLIANSANSHTNVKNYIELNACSIMLQGTGGYITFDAHQQDVNVPNLGPYQFNDRIDSFYMDATSSCYTVFFFRDENYGGRSISFTPSFVEGTNCTHICNVSSLKDYHMSAGGGSWYRNISSFKIIYTPPPPPKPRPGQTVPSIGPGGGSGRGSGRGSGIGPGRGSGEGPIIGSGSGSGRGSGRGGPGIGPVIG